MSQFLKTALAGAAAVFAMAGAAVAADIIEPPMVIETPPAMPVYHEEASFGGWYIRGDVDYHWSKLRGSEYITYGPPAGTGAFATSDLKGAWSIGGGVGYKISKHLRTDLTLDWFSKSEFTGSTVGVCGAPPAPCTSSDTTSYSALLFLANAYVDLGTYHGITPYVGAGIGGARVKWDDLSNTVGGITTVHGGAASTRFAYALMAGASYCVNDNIDIDLGYRFTNIEGGRMFEYEATSNTGPGFDHGIHTHEVRAGLRWKFGNKGDNCGRGGQMKTVEYTPVVPTVYK